MIPKLTIKAQLLGLLCGMSLMLLLVGSIAVYAVTQSHNGFREVYESRTLPISQVSHVRDLLMRDYMLAMEAIHDPSQPNIQRFRSGLVQNQRSADQYWAQYAERSLSDAERRLADDFNALRREFVDGGLKPMLDALADGDLEAAYAIAFEDRSGAGNLNNALRCSRLA